MFSIFTNLEIIFHCSFIMINTKSSDYNILITIIITIIVTIIYYHYSIFINNLMIFIILL